MENRIKRLPGSTPGATPGNGAATASGPRKRRAAKKGRSKRAKSQPNPIDTACQAVASMRHRPLLVLYYPSANGAMLENDVMDCHDAFRNAGVVLEEPLEKCDILVHTSGGSPVAAYRIGQCIRSFAKHVEFLVPDYAYSGGTLLCFAGNAIHLGHCAGLSPIDITMVEQGHSRRSEVQLASIDSYLNFCDDAQDHVQRVLEKHDIHDIASVTSNLLGKLVDQTGALKVGHYYRTRMLTAHYARELLQNYLLANSPNKKGIADRIVRSFLFGKPAHEFHMDLHICRDAGLDVKQMSTPLFDATRAATQIIQVCTRLGHVCKAVQDDLRQPFIAYYPS